LLGDAYLNLNQKYDARLAYRKALELDPNDVKARNGLAALDDFGEAVI
jgi:Flp pilus assembly protein TadD